MEFTTLHSYASGKSCSVVGYLHESLPGRTVHGTASASKVYTGIWYLNRVLVQPSDMRGKGLGTQLLKQLLKELSSKDNFECLFVEPGGYGQDPVKQVNFYLKNGFEKSDTDHTLMWRVRDGVQEERHSSNQPATQAIG